MKIILLLVLLAYIGVVKCNNEEEQDYYKILGLDKTADTVQIRRAFKKLAVTQHPDKNVDDPEAHKKFVKIAEAYEVLKDPKKRSEYDIYGKTKFQNQSPPQYHSYTYYRDQFGIYDDDPLVVTLTGDDFENSVADGIWFVNFYSPMCSHCHILAPDWKKLSQKLQGVIKIAAVNCGDERQLCWDLQIQRYPTLFYYSEDSKMMQGLEYRGTKEVDEMEEFIMQKFTLSFTIPTVNKVPNQRDLPHLLFLLHPDSEPAIEYDTVFKLSAVLKGLVSPLIIRDKKLIKKISGRDESSILYQNKQDENTESHYLHGDDFIDMAEVLLAFLPEVPLIDTKGFQDARSQLRADSFIPWLFCFTMGLDTEKEIVLKKLTAALSNFNIGEINCGKNSELCNSLHIVKYPTWGVLKKGGAFEVHSGRNTLHAIERFARDSETATNLHALSPQDLQRIMSEGTPWFIGWLLHGCPPCKKMLPALRKASHHFNPEIIQFGTVDCGQYSQMCTRYNVQRYPTAIIYNATKVQVFQGDSNENSIVEFINMMQHNYVTELTKSNYYEELGNKDADLIYVVEYFAPWCGPCQQLQPEWRKMAKKLSHFKNVKVGAVNCDTDRDLCNEQSIRSYPTIRLYPSGTKGMNSMAMYSGDRSSSALYQWVTSFVGSIKSPIVDLFAENYKSRLLSMNENRTWVVMFFAPWCKFCHHFEPEFVTVVQRLENLVIGGKVDCVRDGNLCMTENISAYPTVKLFQRINGVTKIPGELKLNSYSEDALYSEIKKLAANAFVSQMKRDEL